MSMGEKLVEAACAGIEKDLHGAKATRRALCHGIFFGFVIMIGLAISAATMAKKSGIGDAIDGGRLAKVAIPNITDKLTRIDINMARLAGAVDALTGGRTVTLVTTQDESRVCNQ